jgi:hypothetical protein
MQYKNTNKRRKMAVEAIVISVTMVFALASNIYGHNIQIALANTKNNNSPTRTSSSSSNPNQMSSSPAASSSSTDKATKLVLALRDLWADHTGWTRNYIISFVAGLPDTNFAPQRLLKNQVDIGNSIKPFYGSEAGDKLTSLIKDHIMGAVDLLKATKSGNTTGTAAAEKWYENADQIATFLSNANPNWSKVAWKSMLDYHLAVTKSEAVARLTGNYAADITAYDKVRQGANMMSDTLVEGIVKQFPGKFSSSVGTTTIATAAHAISG